MRLAANQPARALADAHLTHRAHARLGPGIVGVMNDEDLRHHFVTMLGGCLDGARLAKIHVELELDDGQRVSGVPGADLDGQVNHTGVHRIVEIDGELVNVERVVRYSIPIPV